MATYKLTPDTGEVSGTHSDMPLVVIPSDITNFPSLTSAEAESIRFYSDASLSTELPREVVSADEIHVKVSSVSSSTEIWADYDGVRSDYAATDTYGRNNVWSEYGGRYHMDDVSGGILDSTGNNGTATEVGNPTYGVAGEVGNAIDFDGGGDRFDIADAANTDFDGEFTISYLVNFDALGSSEAPFSKEDGYVGSDTGFLFYKTSTNIVRCLLKDGTQTVVDTTTTLSAGTTYKLTATRDASNDVRVYIDKTLSAGPTTVVKNLTNTSPVNIGERGNGSQDLDGTLDELYWMKGTAISSDWLDTEHNNQNDNAAFWVATEVETVTASPIAHILQMI